MGGSGLVFCTMSTYTRNTNVTFSHSFVDPGGNPQVPLNASYPSVQVTGPAGSIVASGVASATATPGLWNWSWTVPPDAALGEGWAIDWMFIDGTTNSTEWKEAFKVSDQIQEQEGLDRTSSYLSMRDTSERLIWKNADVNPEDVQIMLRTLACTMWDWRDKSSDQLHYLYDNGYHTYWTETGQLREPGEYLAVWRTRDSAGSPYVTSTQNVFVPYDVFWFITPYLRQLLDKLSKTTRTPLSYLDLELYWAFDRGLEFVNAVHPRTNWTWADYPAQFLTWWVFAAGIFALNARQLLEIEVQHQLSALSVTLDYDHAGPLADVIQRYEQMLREWFSPAKLAAFRAAAGPGQVAVRPFRVSYQHRVYRIGASNQALSEFPGLMSALGIIY